MKHSMLFRFLFVFSATLFAAITSMGTIYEKTGFYAGFSVGGGYNAGSFKVSGYDSRSGRHLHAERDRFSVCGFEKDFGVFVGYTSCLSKENWLIGVELGIEKPFCKKHIRTALTNPDDGGIWSIDDYFFRLKPLYVAKLHTKIGKIIDKKLFVYGLAGLDIERMEIFSPVEYIASGKEKFLFGIAVGLGFEREIGKNWRLGLEFTNTYYPAKTLQYYNYEDPGDGYLFSPKIRGNSSQVALRLIHNF